VSKNLCDYSGCHIMTSTRIFLQSRFGTDYGFIIGRNNRRDLFLNACPLYRLQKFSYF